MKICQLLQSVDNPSAGPTNSVGQLSHYLARRKHSVTVMALGKSPNTWPHASSLEMFGGMFSGMGLVPFSAVLAVRRHALETSIMHGHGVWRLSNLFPLILGNHSQAKVVWSPRGMFSPWAWNYKSAVKRPFWHLLQKPALMRVDCFHATADNELDDIRRLNFRQPVAVIPNGVDIPDITGIAKEPNRVVFLSRIHEKKGLHLLIPAWRAIENSFPGWELHIAGKIIDDYGRKMVALAAELGTKHIQFRGEVLGEEKRQLLAGARLFVLPTFSENFGIAIAEAMAHGTPVITTYETPWTSLAKQGSGWCIEPSEAMLTETLRQALSLPPAELDMMGARARKWMERSYSWETVASMMENLYGWLLNNERKKPDYVDV
jgi:glycosyltransferase involved in cell wall biosynthesis